ncbi:uncharacterized protein LTR77_001927 [Saxophila tyrrhenica]|uniref:Uncharacterized protein n=1 Tax=Saxophila tyrrhenica TaxID=1690608 RepID=A0AAV9PLM3_9PEZI|nr:hypothetical protein LTR77_001927 [Saxophila tyrrhenica]
MAMILSAPCHPSTKFRQITGRTTLAQPEPEDMEQIEIYDILIIGARPCGLATAARLKEKHPSALFTDEEQRRYSWIQRHAQRASASYKWTGKIRSGSGGLAHEPPSVLVFDSSADQWIVKWKTPFAALEVEHLRNRDALLAFVHRHGRAEELQEIVGRVGKENSKHQRKSRRRARNAGTSAIVEINERDREDYFAPSARCFHDFCEASKERYHLNRQPISQETVQTIDYLSIDSQQKLFECKHLLGDIMPAL